MIQVVPYTAQHFAALTLQEGQAYLRHEFTQEQAASLENTDAFTALSPDGDVLCCAGVVKYWENRGEAWAFMSPHAKPYALAVTRAIRRFLKMSSIRRIEAAVDVNFPKAIRWTQALGFEPVSRWPMKAYKPDGTDCWLFARVK